MGTDRQAVYTYFADDSNGIEQYITGLIEDGAIIDALAIGYGPPPAKVAAQPYAPDASWHGMVVVRWPNGIPENRRT